MEPDAVQMRLLYFPDPQFTDRHEGRELHVHRVQRAGRRTHHGGHEEPTDFRSQTPGRIPGDRNPGNTAGIHDHSVPHRVTGVLLPGGFFAGLEQDNVMFVPIFFLQSVI